MNDKKFRFADDLPAPDVKARKAALRRYMKERRGENENRDVKETLLTRNFFESGAGEGQSFFVYLSFSSEAPTDRLIEELLARGKTVYCPRVEGDVMRAVPFSDELSLSPMGIREPIGEAYEGKIDVAVTPLLAADEHGRRLGYGGGYYDRFFVARAHTLRVGYCFDFQLTREVPTEERDTLLDLIVTDRRVLRPSARIR